VFSGVWSGICKWLGISSALKKEGHLHLEKFGALLSIKKVISTCVIVILFSSIWKARNDKCFHNKGMSIDKMMEDVNVFFYNWMRFKAKTLDYNINQWCINLRACMGVMVS
jgi:hypothetical protein